jgi:UDP-GlcNAc:undecaprenyl-phosphate/decaprenyl-phosphate GlcNAc-1-phosphate transferase
VRQVRIFEETALTGLYLASFTFSLLLSFVLTRFVRDFAFRRGWVSMPSQERHMHRFPLPRLGGVAICFAFLTTQVLVALLTRWVPRLGATVPLRPIARILIPAFLIFLLGVYDDVRCARPWLKFVVQGIAGAILFLGGLRILSLPLVFGERHFSGVAGLLLTILWVIGITNAFNLIDGLDGLAAGSALFSTLVVFIVALVSHSSWLALSTIVLAGAILGFLRFNFNPATIFLGDSGSLFIGFLLSAFALQGATKAPTVVAVAIPVVSFGLPILETGISILRRLISGRPVFTGDREHIHHKLLDRGLSHRQVVIVLYGVSGLFALLSLFLLWPTGSTLGLVLAVVGCGVWIGIQHLGYLEFGELRRVAQRTMEQPQVFINNLAIRRAVAELKVAGDYSQVCKIVLAAFETNDFDRVDWKLESDAFGNSGLLLLPEGSDRLQFHWQRAPEQHNNDESLPSWRLQLDLLTGKGRPLGRMMLFRVYSPRALQLDINLLTTDFPAALATALERTLPVSVLSAVKADSHPALLRTQVN